jgi:hypothetical protein
MMFVARESGVRSIRLQMGLRLASSVEILLTADTPSTVSNAAVSSRIDVRYASPAISEAAILMTTWSGAGNRRAIS